MICIDCGKDIPDEMGLVGALSIHPGDSLLICKECVAQYYRSTDLDIRFDDYRRNRPFRAAPAPAGKETP